MTSMQTICEGNLSRQSTHAGYFSNLTQIKLSSLLQAEAPFIPICVALRTYTILSARYPSLCSFLHSFTFPICYLVIKDVPFCCFFPLLNVPTANSTTHSQLTTVRVNCSVFLGEKKKKLNFFEYTNRGVSTWSTLYAT